MNHNRPPIPSYSLLKTCILSLSLIIASTILGAYMLKSRQIPRTVTVKGLAEREVTANIGIWPICFRIVDDDLGQLQRKLERNQKAIVEFLNRHGFTNQELTYDIPNIEDKETYTTNRKIRYALEATITLCSSNVSAMEQIFQKSPELIAKGIALENKGSLDDGYKWYKIAKFIFTNLNEIQPAMMQEATLAARKTAEQFAKDSDSHISNICQATQGVFSIEDTHIPTQKHVRVVNTLQYRLTD